MTRKMASSCTAAFMALVLAFSCFAFPASAAAAGGTAYTAGQVDLQAGYPTGEVKINSIGIGGYDSVAISWTPVSGADGYKVYRGPSNTGDLAPIATVSGGNVSTTKVKAPWDVSYMYLVAPYGVIDGEEYEPIIWGNDSVHYTLSSSSIIKLASVTKKSGKYLQLKWTAQAGASSYTVYRSTQDGRGYKKIATTKSKSYIDKKAKKGVTYYYQVRANYPGYGTAASNSYGQIITKSSKAAKKTVKLGQSYGEGSYAPRGNWGSNVIVLGGGNWASPDLTSYYTKGSRLYAVSYVKGNLKIYGFNSSMKRVSAKTVKLPKHQVWGGFYHGPDGNNYVAIGWNNLRESKTKTVIQVIKYSSGWKKSKTASIKGGVTNMFEGIWKPFNGGTASFAMDGSKLYVHTCREMFLNPSDGLHHQSNISFTIDTKTMKAKVDNVDYTSHSFNQLARVKDGELYLADHGDGYPRGIKVVKGYMDECTSLGESFPDWSSLAFTMRGGIGENFTGAAMGGMEVGAANVLTCGISQPHNYAVAGVKGYGDYKQNVYLTVTNRVTGKSSVKWLTTINPRKGRQTVSEARMVKLADDRFAVMYSVASGKSSKLYCTIVNGAGKKVKTKTYKNYEFTGSVQPVLMGGNIYWSENTKGGSTSTMYRIPAL